jgi:NADH:ubiquinone oxidoreductase subunit K
MPVFNALLFGTLLYRSRLVPRIIPTVGLIGAPLLLTATLVTFFGHNTQTSNWSAIATLPIAAWELAVGLWMLIKGFNTTRTPAL